MLPDLPVWQLLNACLRNQVPVMLLQVVQSQGSSPGRQGFRMAVAADGRMEGSIGGGIMEHKLVELARKRLADGIHFPLIKRQIHSKEAPDNQSGMICSGEQTVALLPVHPSAIATLEATLDALGNNRKGVLQLSQSGIAFEPGTGESNLAGYNPESATGWLYRENLGIKATLYVIGGGHVGLAFSRVMAQLGFYVTVIDDREDLHTMQLNRDAHRLLVHPYPSLAAVVEPGPESYVAIMTVGYRTDKTALKALLGRPYRYLGLMGSKAKINQLFAELHEEGYAQADLEQVIAPIGLQINSRTPDEIAISIAAQIIQVRNRSEA